MMVYDHGTELVAYLENGSVAYAGRINVTTGMAKVWNNLDGTECMVYFKDYEEARQLLVEAYNLAV